MTACSPADRLLQTLRVETPGAADAIIELQLYNTVDEFLRRTNAWTHEQEIELVDGILEYPMDIPVGSTPVRTLRVEHNNVPVPSAVTTTAVTTAFARLLPEETFPDGDTSYAPETSDLNNGLFTYAIYRPDYITVTGTGDTDTRKYPLKLWSSLSVARSCLECGCGDWPVPDWMFDTYFDVWLHGTLGRLMAMVGKPWSNTTLAGYHNKRFRDAMAFRKQEARRGFSYNTPAWRFPGAWTR